MSCALTRGRLLGCKDSIGGIKTIVVGPHADLGAVTVTSDEVTAVAGTITMYQYDLPKHTGSLTDNITVSVENGTVFYEQVIAATLHKLTKEDHAELKLLAQNRLAVFVEDVNDNIFLIGRNQGAEITAGTAVTGTAKGDMNGYTLEIKAEEIQPSMFVARSAGQTLDAALEALGSVTVTQGT